MAGKGLFDPDLVAAALFDEAMVIEGWYDRSLIDSTSSLPPPISIGVHTHNNGSTTSLVTSGINTTTGSTLVVFMAWATETFTSLADSNGNTWTQIQTEEASGTEKTRAYYCTSGGRGAAHTFTLAISGANPASIYVCELIPQAGYTISLDQSDRRRDGATPFTLAAGLTTTVANEALLAFIAGDSGSNPATMAESGLGSSTIQEQVTNGSADVAGALATQIVTATGTFNPSFTQSGATNGSVWLATFKAVASGAYTLTAAAGSYSYSGVASGIQKSRVVTAVAGSYSYSGVAANALKSKLVTASAGSYAYTGVSTTVLKSKSILANAGAYSYNGVNASLLKNSTLTSDAGSYAYTGQAANVTWFATPNAYTLTANAGSYIYTGVNASLLKNNLLTADAGAYAYVGKDAILTKATSGAYVLTADSGSYVLSGNAANISYVSSVQETTDGNWNQPKRKKFVYKLSKKARKEIEEVAALGLDEQSAEIALRLRIDEWDDAYLEAETMLQKAIALRLASNISELKRIDAEIFARIEYEQYQSEMQALNLIRENNRRIAIIMMLG